MSYYHIGAYNEAIKFLKQYYIKNNPDIAAAYLIGVCYFKTGQYKLSFKYLNIANTNSDHEIFYYLGVCSYQLGDYTQSVRFYKKSLILSPNNPNAIYSLGQSYIDLNNKKEAKRQLKVLMGIDINLFELLKLSFDTKFNS